MKVHRWQSQDQRFQRRRNLSTWCHAARGARRKVLRKTWDVRPIPGTTMNVHRIHFLERAQFFFSRAHTAHSVAQDKVVSASFIVIPHAHSHFVSPMSLLNVKFTPFPSLLSSPSASSSRVSTSLPGRTRSWCQSPDAPARWRESGRLVDTAPKHRL